MPESRQELEQQLEQFEVDQVNHGRAVEEARQLLERADRRRRENPDERRRWNRTVDSLEAWLAQGKHSLTGSQQNAIMVRRRLGRLNRVEAFRRHKSAVAAPPEPPVHDPKEAAMRLLHIPVVMLSSAPSEDIESARAYVNSPEAESDSAKDVAELRRRLGLLDRGRKRRVQPRNPVAVAARSTKDQLLLRCALKKCTTERYGDLTVKEIDLLMKMRDAIYKHAEIDAESRLSDTLDRAIAHLALRFRELSEAAPAHAPQA